ncbi:MAG: hypothetical protein N2Z21_09805 [Candidatus Sumerlaeaceae bacterium]|nr:hypothetical protein [Candidatus Sumerlaeaceae bacterium]
MPPKKKQRHQHAPGGVNEPLVHQTITGSALFEAQSLLHWLIFPSVLFVVIVFVTVRPISDPDCWFHMAHGRYFLEHGEVLKKDIFSHTAQGREWISSGWLASVLMQAVFHKWGPTGLILFVTTVVTALYLGSYLTGLIRGAYPELLSLILLCSLLAGYMRFNPRPDLFSLSLIPLLLLFVIHVDTQLRTWKRFPLSGWAIPVLIMAWANLHAGFLAGLIAISLWLGFGVAPLWSHLQPRDRFIVVVWAAASFLAWIANPYGWRILELAGKIRAIPGVRMLIFEWMPLAYLPGFNLPWPTYGGFVALGLIWIWLWQRGRESRRWWHFATFVFLAVFAIWQRRQAGLFAAGVPVLALPYLQNFRQLAHQTRTWVTAAVFAGALGICGLQYRGILEMGEGLPVTGVNARMLPCIPTEYLETTPVPQKLFNSYAMGGYLLYHLREKLPVFIDGRLDVYDPSVWADYLAVEENRLSVDAIRQKYGVNTFAIDIREALGDPIHLGTRLANDPAWALLFFDDDYAIFAYRAACAPLVLERELRFVNPFKPETLLQALRSADTQEAALRELGTAVALSNGSALAYALTALAAEQTGEKDAALRYRSMAAQRDPLCPLLTWSRLQAQSH